MDLESNTRTSKGRGLEEARQGEVGDKTKKPLKARAGWALEISEPEGEVVR